MYIVHIKIYTYTDHTHRVYIQYTFPIFLTYSLIINNNNQKNILVVSSSMIINILWWSHPVFSSTSLINSSCGYYKMIKYKLIWLVMEEQINRQTHVNKIFPITSHTPLLLLENSLYRTNWVKVIITAYNSFHIFSILTTFIS